MIPCDGTVTFYWDSDLQLGTAPMDANCTATIQTSPPAGLAIRLAGAGPFAGSDALLAILGDHRVTATSCTAFACYTDTQTYTIDPPPPPTPKPTAKPTPPADGPSDRQAHPAADAQANQEAEAEADGQPGRDGRPGGRVADARRGRPSAAPTGAVLGAVGTPKPTAAAAGGAVAPPPPGGAGGVVVAGVVEARGWVATVPCPRWPPPCRAPRRSRPTSACSART